MRLRLICERSYSAGLGRSVRVWKHVGFIFAGSWLQAREILLDEDAQGLAAVERLLTFDRYLVAVRPALHGRSRQHDRDDIRPIAGAWRPRGGIAREQVGQ